MINILLNLKNPKRMKEKILKRLPKIKLVYQDFYWINESLYEINNKLISIVQDSRGHYVMSYVKHEDLNNYLMYSKNSIHGPLSATTTKIGESTEIDICEDYL